MYLGYHPCFYLVFLIHFLPYITAINYSLPYTPTDLILLNCGTSSIAESPDGRLWDGDARSKFISPSNSETTSSAFSASQQNPFVTEIPYKTARIFHSNFTYTFPLSPGPKFVRFYFHPTNYSNLDISNSFFSLAANHYTLLSNFSAFLAVSAMKPGTVTFIKEYIITVFDNQQLRLTFFASPGSFAFTNGIEIVSIPSNLYTSGDVKLLNYVGFGYPFGLDSTAALETFYRLNVGGQDISGLNDTGMYRTWLDDSDYIFGNLTGVVPSQLGVKIKYASQTPAYTAPELVYRTMRSLGPDTTILSNLTWHFSVDAGFNYLFRLYFCETKIEVTSEMLEVFFIFINNQTAEEDADIIHWSSGNSIPVYRDYVVWVPKGSQGKQDLWLTLYPNFGLKPVYADATLNGLEVFKLNNSDGSLSGSNPELKVPPPLPSQLPRMPERKKGFSKLLIVSGSVIGVGLPLFLVICFFMRKQSKVKNSAKSEAKFNSIATFASLPTHRCHRFTIDEMKAVTRNFNDQNIIGSGGFGNVYKGYTEYGCIPLAIKRLESSSKQGIHEFQTEIEMLSQLRHINLVSLIGYCIDEGEMILVYDYMTNGTLQQHLYETNNDPLPWKQRLQICIGAARGLHYLHSEMMHTIIHRDVKTTNILLDEKWNARVSDFGLSKVAFSQEVSTIVKGTWGYLDPEYSRYQRLTEKSDVYSFGVVLLEVLCARKPVNHHLAEEQMSLVHWARKCTQNGTIYQLIDPHLKNKIAPECFNKFVGIVLSCVHNKGTERPTMRDIMGDLEFALQLQEAADSEMKILNPEDECVYSDVTFVASRCRDVVDSVQLDSSCATIFTTEVAGSEVKIMNPEDECV